MIYSSKSLFLNKDEKKWKSWCLYSLRLPCNTHVIHGIYHKNLYAAAIIRKIWHLINSEVSTMMLAWRGVYWPASSDWVFYLTVPVDATNSRFSSRFSRAAFVQEDQGSCSSWVELNLRGLVRRKCGEQFLCLLYRVLEEAWGRKNVEEPVR